MAYSPTLGRWMQQDPEGYVDGLDLYEIERSSPADRLDPIGLYQLEIRKNPAQAISIDLLSIPDPAKQDAAQTDFRTNYLAHDWWGQSKLVLNNPGKPWKPYEAAGNPGAGQACGEEAPKTYVIDGYISTYVRTLSLSDQSAARLGNAIVPALRASIAAFNRLAAAHEDKVARMLQAVWSPPYTAHSQDEDEINKELAAEYDRRDKEWKSQLDVIHWADMSGQYNALLDITGMTQGQVPVPGIFRQKAQRADDQRFQYDLLYGGD